MTQAYRIRGGHEAHLLHFATEMQQRGFEPRIVVLDELPREAHRFMTLLRERGIPLSAVRQREGFCVQALFLLLVLPWRVWLGLRGQRPQTAALRDYLANRIAARTLRRRLRRERPDLVHIMGRLSAYAWPELPASRCLLHHGTEGKRDDSWDAAEFDAFRAFAGRAARNLAPGAGVAMNLAREFGIDRPIQTVFTICPSVPLRERSLSPASPASRLRFGILCRLTPEKGIDTLLMALERYQKVHGGLDFCFFGSGVLEAHVRDAITRRGLSGVRLQTEFDDPASVLCNLDVFVHPSLSDAMPLAVAEALMMSLPCIVTRVGGLPDLVRDGEEGLLIEPGNVDALVSAMSRFQAMPTAERQAFAQRARARYEAVCRPDRVGAVLEAAYREVMA